MPYVPTVQLEKFMTSQLQWFQNKPNSLENKTVLFVILIQVVNKLFENYQKSKYIQYLHTIPLSIECSKLESVLSVKMTMRGIYTICQYNVGFEVFTVVVMKNIIFWDMTPFDQK
jgi:hypothetical protein